MPRPRRVEIDLKEKIRRIKEAGLNEAAAAEGEFCAPRQVGGGEFSFDGEGAAGGLAEEDLLPLPKRIELILNIVKNRPAKATTMNYLIMYDIESDKVRKLIAKYLLQKGCLRIQKSVFMANSGHDAFLDVYETLRDINECYDNRDSIIVVPINVADVRSMKLIGKNVNIEVLTNPPNTLFF